MAVLSTTVMKVKPGRWNDLLKVMRTMQHELEAVGAKGFRLVQGFAAGEASGSVVVIWEAGTWEEYGRVSDAFFADPAGIDLLMQASTPEGPIATWQNSVYIDVPIKPIDALQ
jgi:hypothetical protein